MNKIILLFLIATALFAASVEVSVIKPEPSKQVLSLEADGIVVAEHQNVITAKATGIIKLFVNNNSNVLKGDKIAQILDERREQNLKLLTTKLSLVKNELKFQEAKLVDAKEMYKMGVGSKNNYLNEKVIKEQLKENFQTLNSEYETVKLEQNNSIVYATEDATVTNLVAANTYISYGTTLGTLISKKSLVKLFVESAYADKLQVASVVNIQSSYKNTTATVVNILPISTNNLLEVMAKPKYTLPLNLQVNATIELNYLDGLTLPKSAIVLVENNPAIYIIKDGVAHLKYVEILKDRVDSVLIKNNIDKNSQIALKNSYMLHDNLEVIVK